MTMANKGTKTLTKTRDDEESGMPVVVGILFVRVVEPVGPPAVGPEVGARVQSAGVLELGDGAVGVLVVGGVGLPVGTPHIRCQRPQYPLAEACREPSP